MRWDKALAIIILGTFFAVAIWVSHGMILVFGAVALALTWALKKLVDG